MIKNGLVVRPGGERNSFSAGVIEGAELRPEQFALAFGASSAAGLLAFFVAGQIALARRVFTKYLTRPEVYSKRNLLRGRRPYNVHFLVDECCRDLDIDALVASSTALYVGVFRPRDAQTVYIQLNRDNWRNVLKATGALPVVGKAIRLSDGEYYLDGGFEEVFAIERAYEAGCRRILAINNRPNDFVDRRPGAIASYLMFLRWRQAREAVRRSGIARTWQFLDAKPADLSVKLVAPSAVLPSGRFPSTPHIAEKTYEIGLKLGRERRAELQDFLGA